MTVFVTGGAGYIGSHTCVELLEQGMEVVVADNLVNSSAKALKRVEQITGKTLTYYQATSGIKPLWTASLRLTPSTASCTLPA